MSKSIPVAQAVSSPMTASEAAEARAEHARRTKRPIEEYWNREIRRSLFDGSAKTVEYLPVLYSEEEVESLVQTLRLKEPLWTYEVLSEKEAKELAFFYSEGRFYVFFEETAAVERKMENMRSWIIFGHEYFMNKYMALESVLERSKARKREGSEVPVPVAVEMAHV